MTESQTEAVAARIKAALAATDVGEFSDLLHPDARWGAPDDPNPSCQSRQQVLAWYQRGRDAGVRAEVTECVVFDSRVLIGTRVRGNDLADEAGGEVDLWQVFTVGDGQILEIVGYDNRREALARATG
jgi:ketosteroid isomerase-like protein